MIVCEWLESHFPSCDIAHSLKAVWLSTISGIEFKSIPISQKTGGVLTHPRRASKNVSSELAFKLSAFPRFFTLACCTGTSFVHVYSEFCIPVLHECTYV